MSASRAWRWFNNLWSMPIMEDIYEYHCDVQAMHTAVEQSIEFAACLTFHSKELHYTSSTITIWPPFESAGHLTTIYKLTTNVTSISQAYSLASTASQIFRVLCHKLRRNCANGHHRLLDSIMQIVLSMKVLFVLWPLYRLVGCCEGTFLLLSSSLQPSRKIRTSRLETVFLCMACSASGHTVRRRVCMVFSVAWPKPWRLSIICFRFWRLLLAWLSLWLVHLANRAWMNTKSLYQGDMSEGKSDQAFPQAVKSWHLLQTLNTQTFL